MRKKKEAVKKRRVSHKGARMKGLQFEREVAQWLRMIGFLKAGRHLEFQVANAVGVDIDHTGPFRIQCKNFQKYAGIKCIQEIKDSTGIPVLVTKGNGLKPMAALPLEDFLRIVESYMRGLTPMMKTESKWEDPREMDLGF